MEEPQNYPGFIPAPLGPEESQLPSNAAVPTDKTSSAPPFPVQSRSLMDRNCSFNMVSGKMVKHWSHSHDLKLFEAEGKDLAAGQPCSLCEREISGWTEYASCDPCGVHIHKSCLDIPREIQHRCHPCPLSIGQSERFRCSTCLAKNDHYHYGCKKCEFEMHIKCALFSQEIVQGGDQAEHILHFSHHHPLRLFKDPKRDDTDWLLDSKLQCLVCEEGASGLVYGCKPCDVYLHKACLDLLPQTISLGYGPLFMTRLRKIYCVICHKNWDRWAWFFCPNMSRFHSGAWCVPCALEAALSVRVSPSPILAQVHFHPCSLTLKLLPTFTCNACFANCHTHAYCCNQCDFYVGLKCYKISMESSAATKKWTKHFCHYHSLRASKDRNILAALCKICEKHCSRGSYFCVECDFHVHKSCLQILPQQIEHHHLFCTLVFLTTSSYICIACGQQNSSGLTFRSTETGFKLCMECVLRPKNKLNDNGTFTSLHHWHPLLLVGTLERDANCLLCTRKISTFAYYCSECKDYFHKACAELPLEMQHPLHTQHPLTLISSLQLPESSRSCSLCQGDFLSVGAHPSSIYGCNEKGCRFQLDKKCATSFPSIQYEGHLHPLTVVESMQGQDICSVCSASCVNDIVFRCAIAECKFSLHLACGPLPCKIEHWCHVHSLILEDFYVEDNYTDKFACHFCEKERKPKLPVYRCEEGCEMFCEIECVISEVMPKLLGVHGEVAFRTTFPYVASKLISRDEGLTGVALVSRPRSQTYDCPLDYIRWMSDNQPTVEIARTWEKDMLRSHGPELEREDEDKSMFTFSKQTFEEFSSKLGCTHLTLRGDAIPKFISQHNGDGVRGDFMLPRSLIPIYLELFGKCGLIRATFERCIMEDEEFYSGFVFILCAVIHDMRNTKLVDVTNKRVLQWLTLLKLVEFAEVDISFLFHKIKLVWQAHFLIKSKAIVDNTSEHLRGEVDRLSQEEKELERKLEETRRKKKEAEEQLDQHYDYEKAGMKSLRKELKDVLMIKWKPASSVIENLCQRPGPSRSREEEEESERLSIERERQRGRYWDMSRGRRRDWDAGRGTGKGWGRGDTGRGRGRGRDWGGGRIPERGGRFPERGR